jgi:hypothetical protein
MKILMTQLDTGSRVYGNTALSSLGMSHNKILQTNAIPVLCRVLGFQVMAEIVRRLLLPFLWSRGRNSKDIKTSTCAVYMCSYV